MPLPKITLPTFFVNLISTKKKHKYHPYTVKNQEILLIALEGGNKAEIINACEDLIDSCVEGVVAKELPIFDFEHLFLKLRIVSSGDIINLSVPHLNNEECSHIENVELNLSNIKIKESKEHKKTIELNDSIGIVMKYPTISAAIAANPKELLINCIESIYDAEGVYPANQSTPDELEEWIDNLEKKNINKIKTFFDTMPQIYVEVEYICSKCGKKEKRVIEGFETFFGMP